MIIRDRVPQADPDYYAIISRDAVEDRANGSDKLAAWAREMLSEKDEEAVFLRGARVYFRNIDQRRRRRALAILAEMFAADRQELKRYLRFKGILNLMD